MGIDLVTWQQVAGALAVILGLTGYAFYIRGILEGKVKPHFFSWFVWTILTAIAFVAQVVEGGGPGAWVTGMTSVMTFIFALVGLRAASRMLIAKSDWFYFIGAVLAIPLWYLTGNPLWSVILITVIDAVAFVPTFRKAYFHPESETISTYTLSAIKFIFGLTALTSFTLTTALYPASLVLANGVFVVMLVWRRNRVASGSE